MNAFNLTIIFLLFILIFSILGISTLFFIRFSKYFSGLKFKEFADDTTEGVQNKVKELLSEKDDKFNKDLQTVKDLMTRQYDKTMQETVKLVTTNDLLRKQNKSTEDAINIAKDEFSKLTNVLSGSHSKTNWKCNKGHEWKTQVRFRTQRNCNCPYCSNQKLSTS